MLKLGRYPPQNIQSSHLKRPHHYIRLTRETKMDLQIWECFLESFNVRSLFLQDDPADLHLTACDYTQTLLRALVLVYFLGINRHVHRTWPETWKAYNICFLGFFPIVVGLSLFCQELRNKRVVFMTDNESLVHVIKNKRPKIQSYCRGC